ncbi:MAG: proline--tRNA ligase [Candidatus Aenigmarchaeota archaeon]|nr:proline--tRNA ligase [Candidatus Aenigmarchaeota archaeon]
MAGQGITVKKSEDFSEWYTQVVLKSGLMDYGPVQGTIAFREYSFEIWEKIQEIFNKMIKNTGHRNVYFPLLIPESFLRKEAEHFKNFVPEVFWVTHAGDNKLGERLAIRPTSETIIYHFYSKWIRSWRDLPVLLNQWCNVARAEIKSTKPFIRTSEFLWQEGHTAHATKEEADREVMLMLKFYQELMEDYLAIPVLVGKKSEREKFAGAFYTTTLEALMPDGKAMQMGTSHNLGQNFSKPFGIKFVDKDKREKYVWTTSWGISTRLIGAIVMVHGDDKGLVLPPRIAPYQVVIIPIYYKKGEKKKVTKKAKEVSSILEKNGVRAVVDDRAEYTPGWKFNEWELKGVPIRIEIGPLDIKKKQVVIVRRDNFEKVTAEEKDLPKKINFSLNEIQKSLLKKARKFLEENTATVKSYEEFKKVLEEKGGFIRACWCSEQHCEDQIKLETGATIRIIPLKKEKIFSKCVYCNKKAREVVYFAKAY